MSLSLSERILGIYISWALLTFLIWLVNGASGCGWDNMNVTPMDIYDSTDMNLFGSILVWLLQLVFIPLPTIASIIISFIYWLCHVGRKDK
jgi:hypothetical protein